VDLKDNGRLDALQLFRNPACELIHRRRASIKIKFQFSQVLEVGFRDDREYFSIFTRRRVEYAEGKHDVINNTRRDVVKDGRNMFPGFAKEHGDSDIEMKEAQACHRVKPNVSNEVF
jgi:hypothetical protein